MSIYKFVKFQSQNFTVRTLCKVVKISRSSYYAWLTAQNNHVTTCIDEAVLANVIFDIHKGSKCRYGAPRIHATLKKQGIPINKKKLVRLMKELSISGKCGRKKIRTTLRDHSAPLAKDMVQRDFTSLQPDKLWVGDITNIPTKEGWLFMSSVLDTCTRLIVGWSITDHMKTKICIDALASAAMTRGKKTFPGTIFHSDHGSQYTSAEFKQYLKKMKIVQSMGTVGDSYDNAMAESLWASLKREFVDDSNFTTKEEARLAVFEWVVWYNNSRSHSALDYMSPREYEKFLQYQK